MLACSNGVKTSNNLPVDSCDIFKGKTLKDSIVNVFKKEHSVRLEYIDSIIEIDLNYDDFMDLVINYEGLGSSGYLMLSNVYIFDTLISTYKLDTFLSNLSNISFYIDKKTITSYYLTSGGGDGSVLNWELNKWIESKHVIFEPSTSKSDLYWNVTECFKTDTIKRRMDFSFIPDSSIIPIYSKIKSR